MEYDLKTAIEQMKNKEEAGINYIYSKTYNYVYLRAKCILGRENDIQQLVKDVYLKMIEAASEIEEGTLYEWLGRSVYVLGSSYYRKKSVREADCLEMEAEELSQEKAPNGEAAAEAIKKSLEDLPDMYQATTYAFYYDYMPIADIAEVMDCSIGTIISRLNYTRKFMIKVLENCKEEKGFEVSFYVGTVRAALRRWSVDNCMGATVAQAVYAEICRSIGLHSEAIQIEGKEFAGVNNTVVYYKADDLAPIQSEFDLYSKKPAGNKKILGFVGIAAVVVVVIFLVAALASGKESEEPKKDSAPQKVEEQQKDETEEPEVEKPKVEEPKIEEQEKVSDESEYIFPESSTRALTRAEVEGHTKEELRLARNEIFARHGMIFGVDDLHEYFSAKSWYNPTVPGDEFYDRVEMSMIEEANIVLIQEVEDGM